MSYVFPMFSHGLIPITPTCFFPSPYLAQGHDITAVETNLEESKAKITSDTDQVRGFAVDLLWICCGFEGFET